MAKSSSKASSSKRPKPAQKALRKAVNPAALKWSTVHLPSEAQAGGAGVTQSDYFNSLNWDDDDFMGLQEIDDVQVVQETRSDGSKTTSFVTVDSKVKGSPAVPEEPTKPKTVPRKADAKAEPKAKKRKIEAVAPEPEASEEVEDEAEQADTPDAAEADEAVSDEEPESDIDDEGLASAFRNAQDLDLDEEDEDDAVFDESLLPAWSHLPLHGALKRALLHKKFDKPTEIQTRTILPALGIHAAPEDLASDEEHDATLAYANRSRRDVVAVSQTGSGKTLAYGLPILNYLYENAENTVAAALDNEDGSIVPPPLGALILCPTRELALQVSSHLNDLVQASCLISADDTEISKRKLLRRPQIAVVCGGMSEQKQRRMLQGRAGKSGAKAGVDIIVATPGRLWEMTRLDDDLAARIKQTRFLVLDEADRMVQVGHFAEMENILNLVNRAEAVRPAEGQDGQQDDSQPETHGVRPNALMQTFILSATLSKALQINLKRRKKAQQFTKKKHQKNKENATTLEDLMQRIDFRDDEPVVIDLTPAQGLPEGLSETKIECVATDKDLYLYYFLLRYPGRTLVFVNSIDGIRRLTPILAHLNIPAFPIHSQLQQKQRLKNLDRFRAFDSAGKTKNCVLLATDVAARGLDVPSVEHVVHYQLPRSADTYVHRSGRTARAGSSGVSLALIEPKEKSLWLQLCKAMKKKADIPTFPITFSTLTLLRERVDLALAIDKQVHQASKQTYEDNWLAKLAADADMDLSEDDADPDAPVARTSHSKAQTSRNAAKLAEMKARLAAMLAKPITVKGLSHRYLTASGIQGSNWVNDMVGNTNHEHIVGVANTNAQADLDAKKPLPRKKPETTPATGATNGKKAHKKSSKKQRMSQ